MFISSRTALAATAMLVVAPLIADATVTSTSTFERCVNGDDCVSKLTMQINLQSGADSSEEVLISQVGCPDPSQCGGDSTAHLNNTVKLTFYHTRPVL